MATTSGVDDGYLAVVAHGMLNPLTAVLGSVKVARAKLGPDSGVDELLAGAERQAEFLAELVRDLTAGLTPEAWVELERPHGGGAAADSER